MSFLFRFRRWDGRDIRLLQAQQRFARFFEHALFNPEILRVKLYGADMRVAWSDEPRLLGVRFPENAHLKRALGGQVVAQLEYAQKAENVYERSFARTVELYVPLTFPGPSGVGSTRVAGVVEIYKDPSSMLANLTRDRLIIVATSVAGALVLYFCTTKTRGAGLGLAMARKVVERHGGRIDIESAAGRGTTVRVILPLEAPASAEAA